MTIMLMEGVLALQIGLDEVRYYRRSGGFHVTSCSGRAIKRHHRSCGVSDEGRRIDLALPQRFGCGCFGARTRRFGIPVRLKTPEVYRFCAIPQVMAVATLYECFDNEEVFTGVVKIRKGTAARLIVDTQKGHSSTLQTFRRYALMLQKRASSCRAPPHVQQRVADAAAAILKATPAPSLIQRYGSTIVALAAVGAYAALN